MGDGLGDGYRAGLEERTRQWKLARFGTVACYTCGKEPGTMSVTDPYSFEKYKHTDHLSGEVPERVRFCSQQCLETNKQMLGAVAALSAFIGETSSSVFSPAFRMSARNLIEEVLKKSRKPNV